MHKLRGGHLRGSDQRRIMSELLGGLIRRIDGDHGVHTLLGRDIPGVDRGFFVVELCELLCGDFRRPPRIKRMCGLRGGNILGLFKLCGVR